jgi:hypothetical protein
MMGEMGKTKGATRVDETGWRWMRGRENQREREEKQRGSGRVAGLALK